MRDLGGVDLWFPEEAAWGLTICEWVMSCRGWCSGRGGAAVCDWGCDSDPLGERWREPGVLRPIGQGPEPIAAEKHEDWLLELVRQDPTDAGRDPAPSAHERQQKAGLGSVWRFFDATASASKKSVRAAEQDRPDVAAARTAWADNQPKLDPDRLIFIDETGTSTKMARLCGRAPRGKRLVGKIPHGHWKTTTFVAGLRSTALTAPCVIDGPMNGNAFLAYIEQILVPTLKPGDVVVLDNPAPTRSGNT